MKNEGRFNLSGSERGEINLEKLQRYLEFLKENGQSLPMENGKPNRTAVAAAAGISRNSLYVNKKCVRLLNEFIGAWSVSSSENTQLLISVDAAKVEKLEQRVMRLEQQLANCGAEKEDLRARLKESEVKLAHYQIIEEEVIKVGRRVIP